MRLTKLLILLVVLAPAAAQAQVYVYESHDDDSIVGIAECTGATADVLSFAWTVSTYTSGGSYRLLASDTYGCSTSSSTDAVTVTLMSRTASAATESYPSSGGISVASLVSSLGISCAGSATAIYVCVTYTPSTYSSTTTTVTVGIELDFTVPPAPVASTPQPGDGALHVSWTDGTADSTTVGTAARWRVVATSTASAGDVHTSEVTSEGTVRLGGLENGVAYDVVVYALTEAGNPSAASNTVQGTPEPVEDFWAAYRAAGGVEPGGCSAGRGAVLAALLLPLFVRRARSRS